MTKLLVIEDDSSVRELLGSELGREGYQVTAAETARDGIALARDEAPEVVLLDLRLPDGKGEDVLRKLLQLEPAPEVIILTAHGTVDAAVDAMKAGAFDFLEKPCRIAELLATLSKAVETARLRQDNRSLRRLLGTGGSGVFVSDSATQREVDRRLSKIAASDLPVLVTGETGSGKEITARRIHQASSRADGPFLVVDCGALQPSLIETELFGHERGAFTGAHAARQGLVETARGGTLFLDEIGELDTSLQAKLLRLLESGEFRSVGGSSMRRVDVRFVAATHRDLEAAVRAETFREDLYFRLNVLTVKVPSLRERKDEISHLARFFLTRRGGSCHDFTPSTIALLERYAWPGNVRELRNVVERAVVLAEGPLIEPDDLPAEIAVPREGGDDGTLAAVERQHILRVLASAGGNRARAAEALGISQATLYARLKRYRGDEDTVTATDS